MKRVPPALDVRVTRLFYRVPGQMLVERKATLQRMHAALPSIRISFGDDAAAETLREAFALLCRDTCNR